MAGASQPLHTVPLPKFSYQEAELRLAKGLLRIGIPLADDNDLDPDFDFAEVLHGLLSQVFWPILESVVRFCPRRGSIFEYEMCSLLLLSLAT